MRNSSILVFILFSHEPVLFTADTQTETEEKRDQKQTLVWLAVGLALLHVNIL